MEHPSPPWFSAVVGVGVSGQGVSQGVGLSVGLVVAFPPSLPPTLREPV